jgi:hypothetical protein
VRGPHRSGNRRVWPGALHLRFEADATAVTRIKLRADTQFAGTARASGACQWNVQKLSYNRPEEPEIEQKRREHPQTLKYAHRMLGIEADEHGRQDNHQEPSQAAGNVQLQLKVFPNTHPLIVHARKLIRSLSHPGDVTHWRRHTLATCRCLVAEFIARGHVAGRMALPGRRSQHRRGRPPLPDRILRLDRTVSAWKRLVEVHAAVRAEAYFRT